MLEIYKLAPKVKLIDVVSAYRKHFLLMPNTPITFILAKNLNIQRTTNEKYCNVNTQMAAGLKSLHI